MKNVHDPPFVAAAALGADLLGELLDEGQDGAAVVPLQTLGADDDDGVLGTGQAVEEGVVSGGQLCDDIGIITKVLEKYS